MAMLLLSKQMKIRYYCLKGWKLTLLEIDFKLVMFKCSKITNINLSDYAND